jgi:tetratricopeptide (TPR) repeat protein
VSQGNSFEFSGTYHGPVLGMGTQINTVHLPPPEEVRWPLQLGSAPAVVEHFQDRPETAALVAALGARPEAVLCGTAPGPEVVSGTGGVGKTQLAAHYLEAVRQASGLPAGGGSPLPVPASEPADLLLWIQAGTRESVQAAYALAWQALNGGGPQPPEPADQDAARFLTWLQNTSKRWLLVLDGVPDARTLTGLWPPARPDGTGRLLVTTRSREQALTRGRTLLTLAPFSPQQSLAYLTAALADHGHAHRPEDLAELAADLGHLPLALSQAAAYLLDTGRTVPGYRALLGDRTRTLDDVTPDIEGLPDAQAHRVAAVWDESVRHAQSRTPKGVALPLLRLLSLMDGEAIPDPVVAAPALLEHLGDHRTTPASRPVDADDAHAALRTLHNLNLVDHDPDTGVIRIHQLIQRAIREAVPAPEQPAVAHAAADALLHVWPSVQTRADAGLTARLRVSTAALSARTGEQLWRPGLHGLLFRAGTSLLDLGLHQAAVDYWQSVSTTAHTLLGPEHPHTLTARANLACAYSRAGRTAEAVGIEEQVLADSERLLGSDHPDTLTARSNLANSYLESGRTAEAVALGERVVSDRERLLGSDHPLTLTAWANLASCYRQSGRAAEAVGIEEQVLTGAERILGSDHPDTLIARANLAVSCMRVGRITDAVPLFEQGVADSERLLGSEHPNTLTAWANLGSCYRQAGRVAEAVGIGERVLADRERVIGSGHPDTLVARASLASAYQQVGRITDAVPLFEQGVADSERLLGSEHPNTLTARANLAVAYGQAGRAADAVGIEERVAADLERMLGPDHRVTLTARSNLACSYLQVGRAAEAVALFERVLADRARVLGTDHPETRAARAQVVAAAGLLR